MSNSDINFVYTNRYKLTSESLNRISENIKRAMGIEVVRIEENEHGYIFKGKYGISIGDLTFMHQQGKYRNFNYHEGAKESILKREQEEKNRAPRRKKFKLQKNRVCAFVVGGSLLLALASTFVIKTSAVDSSNSYVSEHANTIVSANDLVLSSWANYAIGQVMQEAASANHDSVLDSANYLKNNFYNDAMIQYYGYIDQVESGLPSSVNGNLKDTYHNDFRNDCYLFDEALEDSYFRFTTFDDSPYADAVVYDQNGNRVVSNGLFGESYDNDGNILLPGGDIKYTVYVKAVDVPGNDYSISNLPLDAKIINGETYVSEEHLDDFINENVKGK